MYISNADSYKFDARAQRVLDVLQAGGRIRYALETGFRGREQFQVRVLDARRQVVKGLGYKAAAACIARGLVMRSECAASSAYAQEWISIAAAEKENQDDLDQKYEDGVRRDYAARGLANIY